MAIRAKIATLVLLTAMGLSSLSAGAAPAASLFGKVVDQSNRPIANTAITVTSNGTLVTQGVTAKDGSYSFSVEAGAYSMRFAPPTTAQGTLNAYDVIAPRTSALVVQLTAPMPGRAFLTGALALSSGVRLASDSSVYFGAWQGSIGTTGTFRLMPTAGTVSSLTIKGADNGNFSFRMYGTQTSLNQDTYLNIVVPVSAQRVRVVTPDGAPVASAAIEAGQGSWGSSPAAMAPIEGLGAFTGTWNYKVFTDAQGWATIPYVSMAQPSSAGYRVTPPKGVAYLQEQFQKVTGSGDITLTLTQRVSTMSGTIKDQNGAGLSGITVFYGSVNATTDGTGAFSKPMPAGLSGSLELNYSTGSERTAGFRYWIKPFTMSRTVFEGATPPTFVVGIHRVTVKVVDAAGAPVANALVLLTDQDGYATRGTLSLASGLPATVATFSSNGLTNAQGVVTLSTLRLDKEILGVVTVTPPTNGVYSPATNRVMVGAGAAVTVTLPRPTVAVTGTVTTSDGTVLKNARIGFADAQGNGGSALVASDGTYAITVPSGTKGSWSLGCGVDIVRDLTQPLCVRFSALGQTISTATKQDFVIPTYKTAIRVVDPAGNGIPNVLVKMSAGHDIVLCRPVITVTSSKMQAQALVMSSATTDASGLASLPMVTMSSPCTAEVSLTPSDTSRYQSRTLALTVGDTSDNVIVLTIPSPAITAATVTASGSGKTILLTGSNFLGAFNVTVDGVASTNFRVVNATTLTIPVAATFAGGTVLVENGGGIATFKVG